MASALNFEDDEDDPYYGYAVVTESDPTLSVKVRFADSENNELENLSTVTPGDSLKARVYVGTDFYSASGHITLFFEDAFFGMNYSTLSELTVNPANTNVLNNGVRVKAVLDPSRARIPAPASDMARGRIHQGLTR